MRLNGIDGMLARPGARKVAELDGWTSLLCVALLRTRHKINCANLQLCKRVEVLSCMQKDVCSVSYIRKLQSSFFFLV